MFQNDKGGNVYIPLRPAVVLEAGEYQGIVRKVAEQNGKFGPQLVWQIEIVSQTGEITGLTVQSWTGTDLTPKSRLHRWAVALLGPGWDDAAGLDTSWLLNRSCRALLTVALGNDGTERNKVTDLLPTRAQAAPRPAAPAAMVAPRPVAPLAPAQAVEDAVPW